jgi:hypothetical protein
MRILKDSPKSTFHRLRVSLCLWLAISSLILSSCGRKAQPESDAPGTDGGRPSAPAKERADRHDTNLNDVALFIAGVGNRQGTLGEWQERPGWIEYAKSLDKTWQEFEDRRLSPMRTWSRATLRSAIDSGRPVFYPFSGPDFINLFTLLPGSEVYLMVGLEPVGRIPDFSSLDQAAFDRFFSVLQQSLNSMLQWDFFITKNMRVQFKAGELGGVLPPLLLFMARDGNRLLDLQYLFVRPGGTLEEVSNPEQGGAPKTGVPGVRITFEPAGSKTKRTLYYFSADLSDDSFRRRPYFPSFLEGFSPFVTYLKAASYLMFGARFSDIKSFILGQSLFVLQDDSGIPFKDFRPAEWTLEFFGTYTTPIDLFKDKVQKDLQAVYRSGTRVRPLPFGTGYRHRLGQSNLMFASKRKR